MGRTFMSSKIPTNPFCGQARTSHKCNFNAMSWDIDALQDDFGNGTRTRPGTDSVLKREETRYIGKLDIKKGENTKDIRVGQHRSNQATQLFVVLLAYGVPLTTLLRMMRDNQWQWKPGSKNTALKAITYMRGHNTWPSSPLGRSEVCYDQSVLGDVDNASTSNSIMRSAMELRLSILADCDAWRRRPTQD